MKKFLWDLFLKSGSIEAFLGFKEFEAADKKLKGEGIGAENCEEIGYER